MIARMPRQITYSVFAILRLSRARCWPVKKAILHSVEFSTEIGRADAPQPWKITYIHDMNADRLDVK